MTDPLRYTHRWREERAGTPVQAVADTLQDLVDQVVTVLPDVLTMGLAGSEAVANSTLTPREGLRGLGVVIVVSVRLEEIEAMQDPSAPGGEIQRPVTRGRLAWADQVCRELAAGRDQVHGLPLRAALALDESVRLGEAPAADGGAA